jgi:tetratricopeptide (TPR) repeat protein
MDANLGTPVPAADDPLFSEGRAHMQAGEWQAAIRCFEQLAALHPGDAAVQTALDDARFKARLDASTRVRARTSTFPWRTWLLRGVAVVVAAAFLIEGWLVLQHQVAPALARAQSERQLADLLAQSNALLSAEKLDEAQAGFEAVLKLAPENAEANAGLQRVRGGKEVLALYLAGASLQDSADYTGALEKFTEVSVRSPGYKDTSARISRIKQAMELDGLFAAAEDDFQATAFDDARLKYEQIHELDANYRHDQIAGRLFDLYMRQGRDLIDQQQPSLDTVRQAGEHFTRALAMQPRNSDAALEQRLTRLYLDGNKAVSANNWELAVNQLAEAFGLRPDYLGGMVVPPLYDAYIRYGDTFRDRKNYYDAWDKYSKAAGLPGIDSTVARGRMASIQPFMTPTATPTTTGTPTPIPTATPYIYSPPTAPPSATPPPPLLTYHNQIVFMSDNPDQPGMYVMNPDGSNRRFLGTSDYLHKQYDELRTSETMSPDGNYRTYNWQSDYDHSPQIYLQPQKKDQFGNQKPVELTHLTKLNYDPVWSPNGGRIAFVSQEKSSDDIWTMRPDGTDLWNRTPNVWEWDKHPSWSPDSSRIAFWTNREGTKQIYVMDFEGRIQTNISMVPYDEYDPMWIK